MSTLSVEIGPFIDCIQQVLNGDAI